MDDLVRRALAMTESGQARQAYEMLEPHEVKRAGDPDFDTVFGIAANQSGEHARAVMALERVTIVQPRNTRARAELGRAMFAVGDSKSARTLLEQAKAQGAPESAALTIDQFLRAIDVAEAQMRSSGRAYVELGIGHDGNVSSGPSNPNVAVPSIGGIIVLAPNAVKRDAAFANLAAGVAGRHVLDSRWSIVGNASVNKRVNRNESFANNDQVNLLGGVSYRVDRQEFTGAVVYEDYKLDGSTNRTQRGLVGEWAYRIDAGREVGAYLQWSRLHYPSNPRRDAHRTVVGGSYAQQLPAGWLAWGGLYAGTENESASNEPQFGHTLSGLRVGVQKSLRHDLSGFAALNYEHRGYGQDRLFLVKRRDNQTTLALGLNWVPAKSWRVTPQLSHIRNNSNIVINDYDRTLISVTARKEF